MSKEVVVFEKKLNIARIAYAYIIGYVCEFLVIWTIFNWITLNTATKNFYTIINAIYQEQTVYMIQTILLIVGGLGTVQFVFNIWRSDKSREALHPFLYSAVYETGVVFFIHSIYVPTQIYQMVWFQIAFWTLLIGGVSVTLFVTRDKWL